MQAQDLQQIRTLAKELGATLAFDAAPGESAYADMADNSLHLHANEALEAADVSGAYWTAMHELGHIADQPQTKQTGLDNIIDNIGGVSAGRMEGEARAWLWAIQNSQREFDDNARGIIVAALGGYLAWYDATAVSAGMGGDLSALHQLAKLVGPVTPPVTTATMRNADHWYAGNASYRHNRGQGIALWNRYAYAA